MEKQVSDKLKSIETKLGNTPIISFGEGIFGKLEGCNPAGSIKDRAAFYIIKRALESGALKPDGIIAEATSGNTGIGLAYAARELGLKCVICMPESMSKERREMLKSYGAELVLTPASGGIAAAVDAVNRICAQTGAFHADQFANYACVEAHYHTTAPEIFAALPSVKHIVAGLGSGGTVMGIKKYIDENSLGCEVVSVEPASSPLISKGCAGAHKIQGIGANFIPDLVDLKKIDRIMTVTDEDALDGVKEIYKISGEKCGISSGAAYSAAKELRRSGAQGDILAILPDNGDRYPKELYF